MSDPAQTPLVSFVVPLYNTGASLTKLLDAFRSLPIEGGWELVLVNDASPDGTGEKVRGMIDSLPCRVVLVDMARNFGEHAAVLEGFRHTTGRFVINLDDDLQNPISEALKILAYMQTHECDVVYTFYGEKKHHWFRNFGSWATNLCASLLLDKPKDLYLSSFRGHRSELIRRIINYTGPYPYIDGLILGATNRIERLQVEHAERAEGESGYTLRKLVRLWMNMFFNFSIMPLRLASILGFTMGFIGLIGLLCVLAEYFMFGVRSPGWASLMATVAIFSGAQLVMLGLIGEYVGRAYMTLSGKPQSLVRKVDVHVPPSVA
jgi:glycosyltransferase involved in cell wall biosynthesis